MTEVLITVNSPGEVATWLIPVVRSLRSAPLSDLRVTVFILPCTYAAGTEEDVVRRIPGVDQVFSPSASLRYIFGRSVRSHPPAKNRVLLFLGGEFSLAARLARRFACPAVAYTEGYINSAKHFHEVYVPSQDAKKRVCDRGVPADHVHIVGNLMVDAALMDPWEPGHEPTWIDEPEGVVGAGSGNEGPLVALFPGSRPAEVRRMLPLLLESALGLAEKQKDVRFLLVVSPFVSKGFLQTVYQEMVATGIDVAFNNNNADQHDSMQPDSILHVSQGSRRATLQVISKRSNRFMARTDLALTIPGSNTAELAVWGVPMLVCLPLQHMVEIPLDGVAGLLDRIPVLGRKLKLWAVRRTVQRTRFTALPNSVSERFVVPELKSEQLRAETIADRAFALLQDEKKRMRMAQELKAVFGPSGAARQIAERIFMTLEGVRGKSSSIGG